LCRKILYIFKNPETLVILMLKEEKKIAIQIESPSKEKSDL
ncbi:hypothetical protein LEMLEM_LOCUS16829, partial [Lemmus lemmus]